MTDQAVQQEKHMQSYMEMIYIDAEDQARHTNIGRSAESNAATWAEFNGYRYLAVDIKTAKFLLDYYNAKGDLAGTVAVDADGFSAITGQAPKSEAEYVKIDEDYWADIGTSSAA